MRKINFKQGKYILPAVVFFPLLFLGWTITQFTSQTSTSEYKPATDSFNTNLPDAKKDSLKNKYQAMQDDYGNSKDYTGVDGVDKEEKTSDDATGNIYSQKEMNKIDSLNAMRSSEAERLKQMQANINRAKQHINKYEKKGVAGGNNYNEMQQYAKDIATIQKRARTSSSLLGSDELGHGNSGNTTSKGRGKGKNGKNGSSAEYVKKAPDKNSGYFNTVGDKADAPELIKGMIDQTVKVQDGTRIRLKLMDDVIINKLKLKKGTYLYANITGFGAQRVMAKVTSILVGDKFLKVALSIYDNDGMEGFYVPESEFRDMAKEAGSQAFNNTYSMSGNNSDASMEGFALQTLQNMYQSASQAAAKHIRKNKAKIKYNTIVYLINDTNNN